MNVELEQELHLPGYTLSKRLGAGGYGEVWLALAPGGLTKAVKFIFGSFHERRAEHELRALQRIKEVRHPFLLSLERIEVVNGRLVIVTELAESSLKDRFDECRRTGQPGIPRAELLKYLRDAADALDFITTKHSLQHLDVKPENLLVIAGHIKVADFGLVKDIGQSQASLVGGLTPLYSAPEVFQGAPSAHSDQYSLAILYQEMLTGLLPFTGQTAAELTLQHLHEEPNLAALPMGDRYVLARALSKDPAQRFTCCSEMIEALLESPKSNTAEWSAPAISGAVCEGSPHDSFASPPSDALSRRPGPVTQFFDERVDNRPKAVTPSMLLDWTSPAASPLRMLPGFELDAQKFHAQPTLVIGVGGAAASILRQLRERMAKRFGDQPVPAIQMLLLDSDPKAIACAMQGNKRSALKAEETLALPLKRPQEYREQSARLMRWLSRRWLYNIPRSLRTEGLRPLGRLAFADHARQIVQRIRMALAQATSAESLASSGDQTGLDFTGAGVRVFVVASISGGVGSGMSIDVGYAVRAALEKAGLDKSQIVGLFVHSTGADARRCDLAKVNAYAWFTEYNHFHRPGGAFPGDESCGLPATANQRAFDSAYLVDLGAETNDDDWQVAARSIAQYIYLDALTPAQSFFDQCRRNDQLSETGSASLRTFALQTVAATSDESIDRAAAALNRQILLRWAGGDHRSNEASAGPTDDSALSVRDTNQLVSGASKLVIQIQLKLDGLASNSRDLIDAQFGGDQQAFIAKLLEHSQQGVTHHSLRTLLHIVDGLFAPPESASEGSYLLQRPLDAIVSPLAMKLAGDLAQWTLQRLDDRQERLAGVERATHWLVEHLQGVAADADRMATGLAKQVEAAAKGLNSDNRCPSAPGDCQNLALAYFRMRIDYHAVQAASLIARRLLAELKMLGATVAEFGRHLKHVAESFPGAADQPSTSHDRLATALSEHFGLLTDDVDQQIQESFIDANGGLFQAMMGNSRVRAQLLAELSKLSRRAVEQLAIDPEVAAASSASDQPADAANNSADADGQRLLTASRHGGTFRCLAIAADESTASQFAEKAGAPRDAAASLLALAGHEPVLCYEGGELPLVQVAVDLIQCRRDYADFASRVLTRTDILWTPITAPPTFATPTSFDQTDHPIALQAPTPPLMTQML